MPGMVERVLCPGAPGNVAGWAGEEAEVGDTQASVHGFHIQGSSRDFDIAILQIGLRTETCPKNVDILPWRNGFHIEVSCFRIEALAEIADIHTWRNYFHKEIFLNNYQA